MLEATRPSAGKTPGARAIRPISPRYDLRNWLRRPKLFNGIGMLSDSEVDRLVAVVSGHVGVQIADERRRRHWTLRELGERASVSPSMIHWLEAGHAGSLETYVRLAGALNLRLELNAEDPRRKRKTRAEDPVHAAMGELLAARLARDGVTIGLDEPFQHYQFAGRAVLVAWSIDDRALLHVENRTRFPNFQEAFGAYNAKRRYLPAVIAERLGMRRGFASVTHVMICLWSAEMLHALRRRRASFDAICPDPMDRFAAWWDGRPPADGVSSSLVVLDPLARNRQRPFVGRLALSVVRPRYAGYADAADALRKAGQA